MTATLTLHRHSKIVPLSKRTVQPHLALILLLRADRITFKQYVHYKNIAYNGSAISTLRMVAELKKNHDIIYIMRENIIYRRISEFSRHNVIICVQDAYQHLIPSGGFSNILRNSSTRFNDYLSTALYDSRMPSDIADDILNASIQQPPNPYNASFFHIRKNGEVSFLPKGKELRLTDNNKWCPSNRVTAKTGKAMRKFFLSNKIKLPDEIIGDIAENIDSQFKFMGTIKLVSGEDIRTYYHGSNYASSTGSLSNSCMKHDRCQQYFDVYTNNPDKIQMLVALTDNNLVQGRALVWHTDEGTTLMDRAYGKPLVMNTLIAHAQSQGWVVKSHQSYDYPDSWQMPNGEVFTCRYSISLPSSYDYYPYMDTFKALYFNDDTSITLRNTDYDGDLRLTDTDGNHRRMVTTMCGEHCEEDDARWSDWYDDWIYYDNAVYSDMHSTYLHYDHAIDTYYDGYIHEDEVIHVQRPNNSTTAPTYQNADEVWYCDKRGIYFDSRRGTVITTPFGYKTYLANIKRFTHEDRTYFYDSQLGMHDIDGKFCCKDLWLNANNHIMFNNIELTEHPDIGGTNARYIHEICGEL